MIAITLQNLLLLVGLVVLIGSFLGSSAIFLLGGNSSAEGFQSSTGTQEYARPTYRPQSNNVQAGYSQMTHQGGGGNTRRPSILAMAMIALLAFGAGSVGVFAYQSEWDTETDLRHLIASLHCDLAFRVGLAPAQQGQPGYHPRNDRDGNGVACEIYQPGTDLAAVPTNIVSKLSSESMVWPTGEIRSR